MEWNGKPGNRWRACPAARSLWPDRPEQQHLAAVAFLTLALQDLSSSEATGLILTAHRQP
jgi:hypothetical protein